MTPEQQDSLVASASPIPGLSSRSETSTHGSLAEVGRRCGSGPDSPLCVSSLKERGRSTGLVERSLVVGGGRGPADGARVQRPQRSEDEQPWGPSRLTQDRQPGTGVGQDLLAVVQGQRAAPSPATAGRGQPEARVPVIPSPRQGGMELCGRSRAGSIKWATTPPGGGHDTHEHAPGCARAVHIACLGAGVRQRTWPSRRP